MQHLMNGRLPTKADIIAFLVVARKQPATSEEHLHIRRETTTYKEITNGQHELVYSACRLVAPSGAFHLSERVFRNDGYTTVMKYEKFSTNVPGFTDGRAENFYNLRR